MKEYYCFTEEDIVAIVLEGCKWLVLFGSIVFVCGLLVFTIT